MTMLPFLIQGTQYIVEQFLHDWQRTPYRWDYERDVQIEISNRLTTLLRLIGQDMICGDYPDELVPGFNAPQLWSRIACEMNVKYRYIDGKFHKCRPDIVILDDVDDPTNPPDLNGSNWPILWACEIKYHNEESGDWDIEKLRYLITQGIVQYGCWIKMLRLPAPQGNGVIWSSDATTDRIRIYDVRLPALNTIK